MNIVAHFVIKFFVYTGLRRTNTMHWKSYIAVITLVFNWDNRILCHFMDTTVRIGENILLGTCLTTATFINLNPEIGSVSSQAIHPSFT